MDLKYNDLCLSLHQIGLFPAIFANTINLKIRKLYCFQAEPSQPIFLYLLKWDLALKAVTSIESNEISRQLGQSVQLMTPLAWLRPSAGFPESTAY